MHEKSLILDTCALMWLVSGDDALSAGTLAAIERASVVFVSAISAWEISLKSARGAIELPLEPLEWFKRAIDNHNLTLAPLDLDILVAANALPWHHRDPTDRFIIATALRERMAIVTSDERFAAYKVKTLI